MKKILSALITLLLITNTSHAIEGGELVVKDTGGFTRAASEVEGGSTTVEFTLTDENGTNADSIEVTITNESTGETKTSRSVAGIVIFEGVTPGVWVVSTTTAGITFTSASIGTSLGLAGAGGGAAGILGSTGSIVVGGAVVAGGAVAISESNKSDNTPLSPSS